MTKSKKYNLILTFLSIFLILLALPKIFINSKGKNIKSMESALLNTKYVNQINSIYLGDSVDSLHFSKQNDTWVCSYGDFSFYADSKIISDLISNFSKKITLIKVSSNYKDLKNYGLEESNAFNISFYNEDLAGNKTEYSSIYFGIENSDRTMIYIRNNRKPDVYTMKNFLYPYLSTKLEKFGNMNLFPIIDENVESTIEQIEITEYIDGNPVKTIKRLGDNNFSSDVHTFFSLRGSTLYTNDILQNSNMKKVKNIKAINSKNNFYILEIYSYTNSIGDEQFFVKSDFPNKNSQCNYVLEISEWTKSRFDF